MQPSRAVHLRDLLEQAMAKSSGQALNMLRSPSIVWISVVRLGRSSGAPKPLSMSVLIRVLTVMEYSSLA